METRLQPGADPDHPADAFWKDLDLDGATLINFDLSRAHLRSCSFSGATFIGRSDFTEAIFDGPARFNEAIFEAMAGFHKAQFN